MENDTPIYSAWNESHTLTVAGEDILCTVISQIGEQRFDNFKDFGVYAQSEYVGQMGQLYAYFKTKTAFNRHWQKVADIGMPITAIVEETKSIMVMNILMK